MSEVLSAEDQAYFNDYAADKTPVEAPAPRVTEAPELDDAPEPNDAPAPEPRKPADTVPHAKFEEERRKRQEAQAEARKVREEMAAWQARYDERLKASQPQPPAQPQQPEPTLETDPTGFLRKQAEELAGLRQWRQQQEEGQRQQQHFQQVLGAIGAQEAEYAKTAPDYNDAVNFLRDSRDKELQIMGITDPNARLNIIRQDMLALAQMTLQRGENMGKLIYEGAVLRGYTNKQAAAIAEQVVDEGATRRRGEDFAAGLGSAGSAPSGALTHEALMEMDDEAFLKAINTKDARRLMGA